jgi:hypothetical protein
MAIQEITIDPKTGQRIGRILPGYDDKPKPRILSKMTDTKKEEKSMKKEIIKAKAAVKRGLKLDKPEPAFSATIMGFNGDGAWVVTKKTTFETVDDVQDTFMAWSNKKGSKSSFNVTRNK